MNEELENVLIEQQEEIEEPSQDSFQEEDEQSQEKEYSEDILALAKERGYREDYEGDNKVDPITFLRKGFDHDRSIRRQNRNLERQIKELHRIIKDQYVAKETDSKVNELKERWKEAVEDANTEEAERIQDELFTIYKAQQQQNQPDVIDQEFAKNVIEDWKADNPWFDSDKVKQAYAIQIEKELQEEIPDIEERLREVTKRTSQAFSSYIRKDQKPAKSRYGDASTAQGRTAPKQKTQLSSRERMAMQRHAEAFGMSLDDWLKWNK